MQRHQAVRRRKNKSKVGAPINVAGGKKAREELSSPACELPLTAKRVKTDMSNAVSKDEDGVEGRNDLGGAVRPDSAVADQSNDHARHEDAPPEDNIEPKAKRAKRDINILDLTGG